MFENHYFLLFFCILERQKHRKPYIFQCEIIFWQQKPCKTRGFSRFLVGAKFVLARQLLGICVVFCSVASKTHQTLHFPMRNDFLGAKTM